MARKSARLARKGDQPEADLQLFARILGAKGGRAGVGESQRRGGSDYYRALRAKRRDVRKAEIVQAPEEKA